MTDISESVECKSTDENVIKVSAPLLTCLDGWELPLSTSFAGKVRPLPRNEQFSWWVYKHHTSSHPTKFFHFDVPYWHHSQPGIHRVCFGLRFKP